MDYAEAAVASGVREVGPGVALQAVDEVAVSASQLSEAGVASSHGRETPHIESSMCCVSLAAAQCEAFNRALAAFFENCSYIGIISMGFKVLVARKPRDYIGIAAVSLMTLFHA